VSSDICWATALRPSIVAPAKIRIPIATGLLACGKGRGHGFEGGEILGV
jgi:hypothetical protein